MQARLLSSFLTSNVGPRYNYGKHLRHNFRLAPDVTAARTTADACRT